MSAALALVDSEQSAQIPPYQLLKETTDSSKTRAKSHLSSLMSQDPKQKQHHCSLGFFMKLLSWLIDCLLDVVMPERQETSGWTVGETSLSFH